MMRGPIRIAAAVALAGLCQTLSAQSGDPGVPVVARASRAYEALSSFEAAFKQHFDDKMIDQPDSRGTLYQEGKNHFAMRFSDPPKDAIIADGTKLWVYTPSETPGQVMRYPLQNHPTYGTNLLGTFLDDAVDRYRITYLRSEQIDNHMTDAVVMKPIASDMPFRQATIWFDRENSLPRRLEIEESRDHKRTLVLTQLQINRSIPPGTFLCRPPAGTKIIDQ
ncbi:MAG: LolA family protein [Gemmatimonadales bacterium]